MSDHLEMACPHCHRMALVIAHGIAMDGTATANVLSEDNGESSIDWSSLDVSLQFEYRCALCGEIIAKDLDDLRDERRGYSLFKGLRTPPPSFDMEHKLTSIDRVPEMGCHIISCPMPDDLETIEDNLASCKACIFWHKHREELQSYLLRFGYDNELFPEEEHLDAKASEALRQLIESTTAEEQEISSRMAQCTVGRSDVKSHLGTHHDPVKWIYAGDDYLACVSSFKRLDDSTGEPLLRPWSEVMTTARLLGAAGKMYQALRRIEEYLNTQGTEEAEQLLQSFKFIDNILKDTEGKKK